MRRRILALLLVVTLCLGAMPVYASAEEPVTVYVTIASRRNLELIRYPVTLTDHNKNGFYDVDDALWLAHNNDYTNKYGGYQSYTTEGIAGLWISLLWGDWAAGWYGYIINGKTAERADTEVHNGDEIYAWVYYTSDADVAVSDVITKFDKTTASITAGESVEVTLAPTSAAARGADVKVYRMKSDGFKKGEEVSTDAVLGSDGKATVNFPMSGTYLITAREHDKVLKALVPPYCVVTVAPTAAYTVSSAYGAAGGETKVTVSLNHTIGEPLTSFSFKPTAAEGLTLTNATFTEDLPYEWNVSLENGVVTVFTTEEEPCDVPTGEIVELTYEVADTAAEGNYLVSLDESSTTYTYKADKTLAVDDTVQSGSVVVGQICGDLNRDAAVNNQDIVLLRQYLVGLKTADDIAVDAADVNADGKINLADVLILARHLAQWRDYATLPHSDS